MTNPIDNTEEECAKCEALATEALQKLKQCRELRRKLSEEIRDLNKRVKSLNILIPKLTLEINGCDTTRTELSNRLPYLKEQCTLSDSDSNKLVALNEKVNKCKADMSSCTSFATELESEVQRLQNAILDAGGAKLKKQQALCDKTLKDLNDTTKKLNTTKVQLGSLRKTIEKAIKAKESLTNDLEECKILLQDKKQDFQNLEEEALEVMNAYKKVQEIEAEKKMSLETVSKECETLKKTQSSIKCTEVEILSKLESSERAIGDFLKRLKHWEDQIERNCQEEEEDDNNDNGLTSDSGDVDEDMQEIATDAEEQINKERVQEECDEDNESPLPKYHETALKQYDRNELKEDIVTLEKERDAIAKNANMAAINEYKKKEKDYLSR